MEPQENQQTPKPKPKSNLNPSTIAFLAFFPITGMLGIHDFYLKKRNFGVFHILIAVPGFVILSYVLIPIIAMQYKNTNVIPILSTVAYLSAPLISYIWAVVEGIKYLKTKKNNNDNQPTPSNEQTTQPIVEQKKKIPAEAHADKALKFVIIRIVAWLLITLIMAMELYSEKDSSSEQKGLFAFFLMGAWIYTGEIIMDIYIIKEGWKGLESKKSVQSIICLVMIPGTWLLAFLMIRLISAITGLW